MNRASPTENAAKALIREIMATGVAEEEAVMLVAASALRRVFAKSFKIAGAN